MPRRPTLATLLTLAVLGLLAAPAQAATHIVQLRDGVSLADGAAAVRAAHGEVTGRLPIIRGLAVDLPAHARSRLAQDPRVATVSANAPVRSLRRPPLEEMLGDRLDTAYPWSVLAPQSWDRATGRGVGVAVIDTGIDGSLPDFDGDDGGSRVVASVVTNPDATTAADTYGHGTHVAGIIAGDGNQRGPGDPADGKYVGIAPRADLIAIKAADDEGRGTILDAIYGLQFVVDHQAEYNIRVVNLSLSSTEPGSYLTDPLDAAVEAAYFHGIVVVAAAGNRGDDGDAVAYAPGNDPFAISVGAVDDQGTSDRSDDAFTDWSSTGRTQDGFEKPDLAAPGAHIVSTLARDSAFAELCPSCVVDGDYIRVGGTSMAAPVVSGVAALLLELHPEWTPDEVKSTLIETARDLDGGVDEVNALAALDAAEPATGANAGVAPSELLDPATGELDPTRSSWGRSSWGAAPEDLIAGWARSSWGCTCPGGSTGGLESTRSSWGSAAWLARWDF
ncbi:MAG TPA: S8 family peptidase [Solirubrobacter sp.]|nr:S8 family peptidase [Solirubrobacter sp.]